MRKRLIYKKGYKLARDDRMWGHDSFNYECWEKGQCLRRETMEYNREEIKKQKKKNINEEYKQYKLKL